MEAHPIFYVATPSLANLGNSNAYNIVFSSKHIIIAPYNLVAKSVMFSYTVKRG